MLDHDPELQSAANYRAGAILRDMPVNPDTRFNGYTVGTAFDDEAITVTTHSVRAGKSEEIARHVVRHQDKAIREALIALGWTPPEGKA